MWPNSMMRVSFAACLGLSLLLLPDAARACDGVAKGGQSAAVGLAGATSLAIADRVEEAINGEVQSGAGKDLPGEIAVKPAQKKEAAKTDPKVSAEQAATDSPPHFGMDALIARLKESDAIGMFTKLALRSDALDMVDMVKAYHRNANRMTLDEVRARFDGLLLKVLVLLDNDPVLSGEISVAREDIWKSLLEVKT